MSRGVLHLLRWSPQVQRYILTKEALPLIPETASHEAWTQWLATVTSFAFENRLGEHYTVRRERLQRGETYWYLYRSIQGRTKKRYLGRSAALSFEHLEEVSQRFTQSEAQHVAPAPTLTHKPLQTMPFLETRLHPPRLPVLLVERSRLLALLDMGQKLTLVHAPAGFGKTTLVAQWLACRQAQPTPPEIAWISLEPGDNDPLRFWFSVITACQVSDSQPGQAALAHLAPSSFAPSPLETALVLLLNDLARSTTERVLILEDYHCIEHTRIHETLAFFIEHLPSTLRVLILTRSEPPLPLVSWRARGTLLEVSSTHLRFSVEETATFLQQGLPHAFSPEVARSLHAHLEGWPAGTRLLALSLQSYSTPQALDEALGELNIDSTGNQAHRSIQEFFLHEIFNSQPEPLQDFLLRTSLPSRLTASLCDVLTGRQDSADWLQTVERSGFFLEALDSVGKWYRYHGLWASTLRAEATRRLGEEVLRGFQFSASHWYTEHAMPVEAIESALMAQKFELAAQLIEKLNAHTYFSAYHTMRRWLELLPEPLLLAQPQLCFLLAQARLFAEDIPGPQWQIEPVEPLLQVAEEEWRKHDDLFSVGILYAFRATFTLVQGHISQGATYARQALQVLPPLPASERPYVNRPVEWIEWHCGCLMALGLEASQAGLFAQAYPYLLDGYTLSLHGEDHVFKRIMGWHLGDACYAMGRLYEAASFYQQTLVEPPAQDPLGENILRGNSLVGLIRLSYERNELEKAEQLLKETSLYEFRNDSSFGVESVRTKLELLRLLLLAARGDLAAVQAPLTVLFVRHQATSHPLQLAAEVLLMQARLQLKDANLASAERTLDQLAHSSENLWPMQLRTLHLLQARLLLAQGKSETALRLLTQDLVSAQKGQHITHILESQLLIAQAYAALKQGQEARHQLHQALSLARSEGFMRLFLDEGEPLAALLRSLLSSLTEKSLRTYAQRILNAFTVSYPAHPMNQHGQETPLLEPLSAQEQRVLTLLAAGRSNPEIAEALIVSINTVKGHVKNLYRKLNVTNRVEAGETARRLKLL